MTHAVAARTSASRGKPDQICADAVDLASAAVTEDVAGPHIEAVAEGERLVTHYFECLMPGYRGWRWAVTVARTPRSRQVTVCETVLLPGPDALTTPEWVPWNERIQAGDLGVGDLMPTAPDDDRLAPGYLLSDDPAVEDVVWELGLGRVRVLSREGRLDAAERWYEGDHGPHAPISTAAPRAARCVSCGFYLPLAGSMQAMFGVCANLYAPDDGQVVSGDHGCGAHSEIMVEAVVEVDEAPTVYDDAGVVVMPGISAAGAAAEAEPAPEDEVVAEVEPIEQSGRDAEGDRADESAQPESVQPEAAQPESIQPEAAQPEAAQPEAAQPEAAQDADEAEDAEAVMEAGIAEAEEVWTAEPPVDAQTVDAQTVEGQTVEGQTVATVEDSAAETAAAGAHLEPDEAALEPDEPVRPDEPGE